MKFFNTAGPVVFDDHYVLPPLERWDLEDIEMLIAQKKYFLLHAPRQTGKTSCLLALRDYLNKEGQYHCVYINTQEGEPITGGSAFNIKAKSLYLSNFLKSELVTLYEQHTEETGQKFESGVVDYAFELTNGQPWLCNALAYEVTFEIKENRDRSRMITKDIIRIAKENLILRRETHLDQLAFQLKDTRVNKVIEPLLTGVDSIEDMPEDDVKYVEKDHQRRPRSDSWLYGPSGNFRGTPDLF